VARLMVVSRSRKITDVMGRMAGFSSDFPGFGG
jgi:hypothetical protein